MGLAGSWHNYKRMHAALPTRYNRAMNVDFRVIVLAVLAACVTA